jgi:CRP/FNR family nitrogen fixation transcriptional regulator
MTMLAEMPATPAACAFGRISVATVAPCIDRFETILGSAGLAGASLAYHKDEEIYGEGEPADHVYKVIFGAVRTYKLLPDGRRQIDAFHLAGDVFGLDSGEDYRVTAEAIVDSQLRAVNRHHLEGAAETEVRVAHGLWTLTADHLRHAEDHMLLLGRKTATERVATFLLEMDRRLVGADLMALPMSRRDIADYLGLTLETVSRTFSQLQSQGVLGLSGARRVALHDRQCLLGMDA